MGYNCHFYFHAYIISMKIIFSAIQLCKIRIFFYCCWFQKLTNFVIFTIYLTLYIWRAHFYSWQIDLLRFQLTKIGIFSSPVSTCARTRGRTWVNDFFTNDWSWCWIHGWICRGKRSSTKIYYSEEKVMSKYWVPIITGWCNKRHLIIYWAKELSLC